jgi:hypothetical protein
VKAAQEGENFKGHPYQMQVTKSESIVERHKAVTTAIPIEPTRTVLQNHLRVLDSDFALAEFWLCIQLEYYSTKFNHPFNYWHWMPLTLEYDYQGQFRRIDDKVVYYEGGETKSSVGGTISVELYLPSTISDAKEQLLRHFVSQGQS